MSEEIKYEPEYGLQKPFDYGPKDATAYGMFWNKILYYKIEKTSVYCFDTDDQWSHVDGAPNVPFLGMRRIIKVPVWKKADQLAGKLPEVGAEVIRVDHEDEGCNVIGEVIATWHCAENNESSQTCLRLKDGTLFLVECYSELRPIESPEEKAQRLEDEWVEKAYDDLLAHIGIHSTESPDFVKQNLHRVYNALLSGELQAPKGE